MRKGYLGFDTSNYRTSIVILGEEGEVFFERRALLRVKMGERGLRQSEALFQHLLLLPDLMEEVGERFDLQAVGASVKPRPTLGSYMPVFRAGESFARAIASLYQIPFYPFSHQEGHIAAGELSLEPSIQTPAFLAVHLSGGTSELLKVARKDEAGYEIERLGGSMDLHAGQLIDRIGVAMGLPFPAGPSLEKLAEKAEGHLRLPSHSSGYSFSFSGAEAQLLRLLQEGRVPLEEIAFALLMSIANTLEKVLRKAIGDLGLQDILIVGGVAANRLLRNRLTHRLEHPAVSGRLHFATPEYSGDHAIGIASLVRALHMAKRGLD